MRLPMLPMNHAHANGNDIASGRICKWRPAKTARERCAAGAAAVAGPLCELGDVFAQAEAGAVVAIHNRAGSWRLYRSTMRALTVRRCHRTSPAGRFRQGIAGKGSTAAIDELIALQASA
jgi:hypothetical protein